VGERYWLSSSKPSGTPEGVARSCRNAGDALKNRRPVSNRGPRARRSYAHITKHALNEARSERV